MVDRWGLANMTLKKFKLAEWFANNALRRAETAEARRRDDLRSRGIRSALCWQHCRSVRPAAPAARDAETSLRRFPTRYEGGVWECAESNKIFAVQVLHSKKTEALGEIVDDASVTLAVPSDRIEYALDWKMRLYYGIGRYLPFLKIRRRRWIDRRR